MIYQLWRGYELRTTLRGATDEGLFGLNGCPYDQGGNFVINERQREGPHRPGA